MAAVQRIAVVSVHGCPLATPGARSAGGMSVYLRHLSLALGELGVAVDVFTRAHDASEAAGGIARPAYARHPRSWLPARTAERKGARPHLPAVLADIRDFVVRGGAPYDLVHSHLLAFGMGRERGSHAVSACRTPSPSTHPRRDQGGCVRRQGAAGAPCDGSADGAVGIAHHGLHPPTRRMSCSGVTACRPGESLSYLRASTAAFSHLVTSTRHGRRSACRSSRPWCCMQAGWKRTRRPTSQSERWCTCRGVQMVVVGGDPCRRGQGVASAT